MFADGIILREVSDTSEGCAAMHPDSQRLERNPTRFHNSECRILDLWRNSPKLPAQVWIWPPRDQLCGEGLWSFGGWWGRPQRHCITQTLSAQRHLCNSCPQVSKSHSSGALTQKETPSNIPQNTAGTISSFKHSPSTPSYKPLMLNCNHSICTNRASPYSCPISKSPLKPSVKLKSSWRTNENFDSGNHQR